MSDTRVHNLYKAMDVILSILVRRGYNVDKFKNYTYETIRINIETEEDFLNNPLNIYVTNEEKDKRCLVIFFLNKKFKKQHGTDVMEYVLDEDCPTPLRKNKDECIFISINDVKESGHSAVLSLYNEYNVSCQLFYIKTLMYNPLNHSLVPDYEVLDEEEIKELTTKFRVQTLSQLPLIKSDDIIARLLGLHPGNVVRVTNKSRNGGTNIYYRYCIA